MVMIDEVVVRHWVGAKGWGHDTTKRGHAA